MEFGRVDGSDGAVVSEAISLVLRFMAMKAQIRISPGVSAGYAWLSREKKEGCKFSK